MKVLNYFDSDLMLIELGLDEGFVMYILTIIKRIKELSQAF